MHLSPHALEHYFLFEQHARSIRSEHHDKLQTTNA
jgi:hypothetical protein